MALEFEEAAGIHFVITETSAGHTTVLECELIEGQGACAPVSAMP